MYDDFFKLNLELLNSGFLRKLSFCSIYGMLKCCNIEWFSDISVYDVFFESEITSLKSGFLGN